ncbi:MAG: NUDIX domain-containing protein [Bacillus subtilis]|nr:NUDIX domain-containing protein [Bacillus subtilis]
MSSPTNSTACCFNNEADTLKWGFPGGLMELEESIADCAVREVFEETALEVRLTGFIGIFNNPMMRWRVADEARILAFAFTGEIVAGTLQRQRFGIGRIRLVRQRRIARAQLAGHV